jgi:hypothetical protein
VLSAQINVMAQRHLWPRALLTPFTDDVQLTSADKRSYTAYAESERHKGFETVDVDFEAPQQARARDGREPSRRDREEPSPQDRGATSRELVT